jgi:hypothetical protein
MTCKRDALNEISGLAKGLPTYAHLLSLHASRSAVDRRRREILKEDVGVAIRAAISGCEETIRTEYERATLSSQKALYPDVLLACAMAQTDEFGRFAPNDICAPMKTITNRSYRSDSITPHLKKFCTEDRGSVLKQTGSEYRWRYQFRNPLLQPFVLMKGLASRRVTEEQLKLREDHDDQFPLFKAENF